MDPLTTGLVISAGSKILGELSPAAQAQRREFRKARDRLNKGEYGFSNAQKAQDTTAKNQAVAEQLAAQQANAARAQASGVEQRKLSQTFAAQIAQNQASTQAESNQAARAQYAADQATVGQQAAHNQQLMQGLGSDALAYGKAKFDANNALVSDVSKLDAEGQKNFMKILAAISGRGRVDAGTDTAKGE
jgi:hypothetical protein